MAQKSNSNDGPGWAALVALGIGGWFVLPSETRHQITEFTNQILGEWFYAYQEHRREQLRLAEAAEIERIRQQQASFRRLSAAFEDDQSLLDLHDRATCDTCSSEDAPVLRSELPSLLKSEPAKEITAEDSWLDLLQDVFVVLVLGPKGSGKSGIGYWLLEILRPHGAAYIVGAPVAASNVLPEWIGVVRSLDEIPDDSLALIDEAYLLHGSREPGSRANKGLPEIVNLSRQRNVRLIFITQDSRQLDRVVTNAADLIVFCNPTAIQASTERREIVDVAGRARDAFAGISGDRRGRAYAYSTRDDREMFLSTELASFWSEEISTLYSAPSSGSLSRFSAPMTREEQIVEAKRMSASGMSFRKIARRFGVSPGTVVNWVKDYPYQ